MAEITLCQQAFVMSMNANQLARIDDDAPDSKPALEKRLATWLADYLPAHADALGEWQIVWGPAVYSDPDPHYNPKPGVGLPDNTVYVARKSVDPPVYVVAIAGTNVESTFGWLVEDGDVEDTVAWKQAFTHDHAGKPLLAPYGNPIEDADPTLALGTAIGVQILLSLVPEPETNPLDPAPVALPAFLDGIATGDGTLVFAGHSLAGALAPTLALALFNPHGGPLARDRWRDVFVLPTAGATPGNADFAAAFTAVFPPVPATLPDHPDPRTTPLWNRDIRNTIDIVPHAWVPAQLDEVPPPLIGKGGLYPSLRWAKGTRVELRGLIDAAKARSDKGAASTPTGATGEAGPYTPLPAVSFACPEIGDPAALIVTIAGTPPPDPDAPPGETRQSYLAHWAPHHSLSYVRDIFHVEGLYAQSEWSRPTRGALPRLPARPRDP